MTQLYFGEQMAIMLIDEIPAEKDRDQDDFYISIGERCHFVCFAEDQGRFKIPSGNYRIVESCKWDYLEQRKK